MSLRSRYFRFPLLHSATSSCSVNFSPLVSSSPCSSSCCYCSCSSSCCCCAFRSLPLSFLISWRVLIVLILIFFICRTASLICPRILVHHRFLIASPRSILIRDTFIGIASPFVSRASDGIIIIILPGLLALLLALLLLLSVRFDLSLFKPQAMIDSALLLSSPTLLFHVRVAFLVTLSLSFLPLLLQILFFLISVI